MGAYAPIEQRFWNFVMVEDGHGGCWPWGGAVNGGAAGYGGYGHFSIGGHQGKLIRAHRFSYELLVGPIPEGMEIDHLCRNRRCVNPAHLEAVTPAENNRRARAHRPIKTHCDHDHEFTPANTRVDAKGVRHCRECGKRRQRLYAQRQTMSPAGRAD